MRESQEKPCYQYDSMMMIMNLDFEFLFYCFGRGTSVARRDQGGGLALPESGRDCCRSRYDAKNPKSAMKTVHHWGPTSMHLGCMIEMLKNNQIFIQIAKKCWFLRKTSSSLNYVWWLTVCFPAKFITISFCLHSLDCQLLIFFPAFLFLSDRIKWKV